MKSRNRILLLLSMLLLVHWAQGQNKARYRTLKTTNFRKVQNAFYESWDGRTNTRGRGYKQFKRWEELMEPRVGAEGEIPNIATVWQERHKFIRTQSAEQLETNELYAWRPLGPMTWENGASGYNPGLGRVNCVAVHPQDSAIIFVGTPSGGLWKSTNGGQSWSTATDELPILGISSIAIHPTNPKIMYIATGDFDGRDTGSIGVLKSLDGGDSWQQTGLTEDLLMGNWYISKLMLSPENPDVLLASTSVGVLKSDDAGLSWSLKVSGVFSDLEIHPTHPDIIYAGGYYGSELHRSVDGGDNWQAITSTLPAKYTYHRSALAVSADQPDYLYVLYTESTYQGVYRSTDGGQTFQLMSDSPNILGYDIAGNDDSGQGYYDLAFAANPANAEEVYVGGIHIWKSGDGGGSWDLQTFWQYEATNYSYVHADIHSLEFFGNSLYAGCDGGIFRTVDNSTTWQDLSEGLEIMQFYRLGQDQNNEQMVVAGAQDNGCNLFSDGNWTHIFGADGMECIVDYTNPNTIYISYQDGGILRSLDGGSSFTNINSQIRSLERGGWVTPYVMHPQQPQTLYAGYQNVWRTDDRGTNWQRISNLGLNSPIVSLAVSESNPDYIYAADYTRIFRTKDGGANWQEISSGLPMSYMTSITVDETDPEKIWVTFSGYAYGEKVYMSQDAGNSWLNLSAGLPNVPVNCIVQQEETQDLLYIGTDIGIFYKDDEMAAWEIFSNDLPNVIIRELEIHEESQKLRAATYGRGIWENDLVGSTPRPNALFAASEVAVFIGDQVAFTDISAGNPVAWKWSFEGATPVVSTEQNPVVNYYEEGLFDVSLTVYANGDSSVLVKEGYIKVEEPLVADFSADRYGLYEGETVQFTNLSSGGATSVRWEFEGGEPAVSEEENPTVVYHLAGEYDVRLAINKPSDTDTLLVEDLISVNKILAARDQELPTVSLFPNPVKDRLIITFPKTLNQVVAVRLLNAEGAELLSQQVNTVAEKRLYFDFRNRAKGVYFVQFTYNGESFTQKVVK
jgi:PKD repeat protein/photosystem II stability/assembly factor-like uncharacterized protein